MTTAHFNDALSAIGALAGVAAQNRDLTLKGLEITAAPQKKERKPEP
jgi:hypothetical protein